MRFVIYADLHKFGPHEKKVKMSFTKNSWHLGDNTDVALCDLADVDKAIAHREKMKQKFGDRYIAGNHELEKGPWYRIAGENNDICLAHGDHLLWGRGRAERYRSKKPGAQPVTRLYKSILYNVIDKFMTAPLAKWRLNRVAQFCELKGVKTIVLGHWHVEEKRDFMHRGIRIIMVPRGITRLNL